MDKQDLKIKQMPPFNIKPGIHVEKLTKKEMESIWFDCISMTNEQFKDRCVNFCDGCKQLSNPHPCEKARVRFGILFALAVKTEDKFMQAIIDDLMEAQFKTAPYYNSPA